MDPLTTTNRAVRWPGATMITGGILAVIGGFMPWITATAPFIGTIDRALIGAGIDGTILFVAGAAVALLGLAMVVTPPSRWAAGVAILPLIAVVAVVVLDYGDLSGRVANLTSDAIVASIGIGPYVSALGALAAVVAVVAGLVTGRPVIAPAQPAAESAR